MTWAMVASAGIGLIGGFIGKKQGDKNSANSAQMLKDQQKWQEERYRESLRDNRPDQISDFGSLQWTTDPVTGRMTQTNKLAAPEAARLEDYRQIAADRMAAAKGGSKIDWNALGFGKMANAVQGTPGDTGRVDDTGVGLDFKRGVRPQSAYPSAGGSMMQTGQPIAPGYQPGQQFDRPPTPPPPSTPTTPGQDPALLAQADALRRQQEIQQLNNASNGGM